MRRISRQKGICKTCAGGAQRPETKEAGAQQRSSASDMKSNRALLLTLMTIIGALMVSVVSYAQTSPATAANTVNTIGIDGGSGRPISQDAVGSTGLVSVALSGSTSVSVNSTAGFAVGDYVRIDDGLTYDFHTVSGLGAGTLSITPPLSKSYAAGGTTTVEEQAVYDSTPTWNPIVGSTMGITPGNHFLVNAKGLSTSNASVVDILLTNGDQLTHNYGHINRRMNVYVLCDADDACIGGPFVETTAPGEWGQSKDAAGTDISEVADFLTLTNARQGFVLGGGYVYGIVVDGGTVFTVDSNEGVNDSLSPTDLAQSSIF